MTITKRVQKELVQAVPAADNQLLKTLRKSCRAVRAAQKAHSSTGKNKGKAWTREEHERFLVALDLFPSGPWKTIADYVGTKDSRQTMTHAQKYRQKHERQQRGLHNRNKSRKLKQLVAEAAIDETLTAEDVALQPIYGDVATHEGAVRAADVAMTEAAEYSLLFAPPQVPALVKQLSDSPRSADEGVHAVKCDPFSPVVANDSLFTLSLKAGAMWLGAKTESDLMEIFADFDEPATEVVWPQMWSTNSLEEIMASCSQLGEGGAH